MGHTLALSLVTRSPHGVKSEDWQHAGSEPWHHKRGVVCRWCVCGGLSPQFSTGQAPPQGKAGKNSQPRALPVHRPSDGQPLRPHFTSAGPQLRKQLRTRKERRPPPRVALFFRRFCPELRDDAATSGRALRQRPPRPQRETGLLTARRRIKTSAATRRGSCRSRHPVLLFDAWVTRWL